GPRPAHRRHRRNPAGHRGRVGLRSPAMMRQCGRGATGWLVGLALLAAIAAGLWWASEPGRPLAGLRGGGSDRPAAQSSSPGGGARPGGMPAAQAPLVTVAEARRQDIRVTIDAI